MPASTRREAPPDLLAKVEAAQVRAIDLQFTDVVGGVKTVTIPASQLSEAIEHGTWFDGSSVELGRAYGRIRHVPRPGPVDVPDPPVG